MTNQIVRSCVKFVIRMTSILELIRTSIWRQFSPSNRHRFDIHFFSQIDARSPSKYLHFDVNLMTVNEGSLCINWTEFQRKIDVDLVSKKQATVILPIESESIGFVDISHRAIALPILFNCWRLTCHSVSTAANWWYLLLEGLESIALSGFEFQSKVNKVDADCHCSPSNAFLTYQFIIKRIYDVLLQY